jgi:rubrerythrin
MPARSWEASERKRAYDRDRQARIRAEKRTRKGEQGQGLVPPPRSRQLADKVDGRSVSELHQLREWERLQAQRSRGQCEECGHTWRPRNPSHTINRCPACGVRGSVTFTMIADRKTSEGSGNA